MCSPYTRGVYVVLQSFEEDGTPLTRIELGRKIEAYDQRVTNRVGRGAVRRALRDLMQDGSIFTTEEAQVGITPVGVTTKQVAHSYMTRP